MVSPSAFPIASLVASAVKTDDDGDELRLFLDEGRIRFQKIPSALASGFRTYSYEKLSLYSTYIRQSFEEHGESNQMIEIELDIAEKYKYHPEWRSIMFWDCRNLGARFLDEPFHLLFALLQNVDAELERVGAGMGALVLPKIDGKTTDISIFELAKLYWASKHLKLAKPLTWDSDLREQLVKAIENIDTVRIKPAFRAVDFMFIWGALRNMDPKIVDAMLAKYIEAEENGTCPPNLKFHVLVSTTREARMCCH